MAGTTGAMEMVLIMVMVTVTVTDIIIETTVSRTEAMQLTIQEEEITLEQIQIIAASLQQQQEGVLM